MLNMAKTELDLFQMQTCICSLKKAWDGFSSISKRYSKANNKFLKSYDSKQESKHIIYLDVNNLYGSAMSKFFPIRGFKGIDSEEFDFNKYTSDSLKGCVLDFDLEYPIKLCELHSYYPLAWDK